MEDIHIKCVYADGYIREYDDVYQPRLCRTIDIMAGILFAELGTPDSVSTTWNDGSSITITRINK